MVKAFLLKEFVGQGFWKPVAAGKKNQHNTVVFRFGKPKCRLRWFLLHKGVSIPLLCSGKHHLKQFKIITMKTTVKIWVIAIVAGLSACKNQDDVQPSQNNNSGNSQITGKVWKVDYFGERGEDETHKFNGYTFRFFPENVVAISSPDGAFEGAWNISNSTGSNRFYLNATGNYQMTEISDDWLIVENSSTLIWLGDDNPQSAGTLRFVVQ